MRIKYIATAWRAQRHLKKVEQQIPETIWKRLSEAQSQAERYEIMAEALPDTAFMQKRRLAELAIEARTIEDLLKTSPLHEAEQYAEDLITVMERGQTKPWFLTRLGQKTVKCIDRILTKTAHIADTYHWQILTGHIATLFIWTMYLAFKSNSILLLSAALFAFFIAACVQAIYYVAMDASFDLSIIKEDSKVGKFLKTCFVGLPIWALYFMTTFPVPVVPHEYAFLLNEKSNQVVAESIPWGENNQNYRDIPQTAKGQHKIRIDFRPKTYTFPARLNNLEGRIQVTFSIAPVSSFIGKTIESNNALNVQSNASVHDAINIWQQQKPKDQGALKDLRTSLSTTVFGNWRIVPTEDPTFIVGPPLERSR